MPRLEFLTRPGCGLCEDALPRVRWLCRLLGRRLEVIDVGADPQLEDEYHLRIPVLRNEHGQVLAEGALGWKQVLQAVRRTG